MSKLSGPLIAECATWLSIVSQLYSAQMSSLLEPHGLTEGQFGILNHIARQPPDGRNRVSDIAAAVQVEQPAVTKALAKFQNMGLVELRPSTTDKRSKTVVATAKTGQLLGTIYQDIGPELHKTFSVIDPGNIEAFIKQLKQLGQWMDKNRQSPKR